ncbi:SDR family oxidoreductase [Verticiella alkaliphila]|uniref:SDR family oxidoreductase n=1 Tax=Verticiella alkaliphila TaxID=2779529 RepID=UPI0035301605
MLCPGFVRTELVESLITAGRLSPRAAVARVPLGRMAEPDEMADALVFLASEAARPLAGQVLSLDGGTSVFTGGVPYEPTELATAPADTALALRVMGDDDNRWSALAADAVDGYSAVVDASALHAASPWQAVHRAAAAFVREHPASASLTVLLPEAPAEDDWQAAGDLGAARMLIATLACELGAKGLRINAVTVAPDATPQTHGALLRYVAAPAHNI